ncbi:alpha/beta hydrolase, partial [Candidatus Daviesbacteria bacterium]|nr:alpha/beta hydrolase [Candidatus Daviesbacteria bacterium]
LQEAYDWDCIRRSVRQVLCLNSDDDPYGCNDKKGQQIVDGIGADKANLIVMAGQGHMGSDFFEQPYREFPFLLSLIG